MPGLVLALHVGCAAGVAVVAAYAYGTADLVWPVSYAGYGALAVVPAATLASIVFTAWMLRWRRVRSKLVVVLVLSVATLLTYALASAARFYPPGDIASQLPGFLDASPDLDRGLRAIRSQEFPVLGAVLTPMQQWLYLGVEGLVLLGVLWLAADTCLSGPFCYVCERWGKRTRDVARRAPASPNRAVQHVHARDWAFFRNLGPQEGGTWLRFDTASCPACNRMHTLSLTLVRRWWSNRTLIQDARLTEDDLRTVRTLDR